MVCYIFNDGFRKSTSKITSEGQKYRNYCRILHSVHFMFGHPLGHTTGKLTGGIESRKKGGIDFWYLLWSNVCSMREQ